MPQEYDLEIDGKKYTLSWDKSTPPTESDVAPIIAQARRSASKFAASSSGSVGGSAGLVLTNNKAPRSTASMSAVKPGYQGKAIQQPGDVSFANPKLPHTPVPPPSMITGGEYSAMVEPNVEQRAALAQQRGFIPALQSFAVGLTDPVSLALAAVFGPAEQGVKEAVFGQALKQGAKFTGRKAAVNLATKGFRGAVGTGIATSQAPAIKQAIEDKDWGKAAVLTAAAGLAGGMGTKELLSLRKGKATPTEQPQPVIAPTRPVVQPEISDATLQSKQIESPTTQDVRIGEAGQVSTRRSRGQGKSKQLQVPAGTQAAQEVVAGPLGATQTRPATPVTPAIPASMETTPEISPRGEKPSEPIPVQTSGLTISRNIDWATTPERQSAVINAAGEALRRVRDGKNVLTNDMTVFDKSIPPDVRKQIVSQAKAAYKPGPQAGFIDLGVLGDLVKMTGVPEHIKTTVQLLGGRKNIAAQKGIELPNVAAGLKNLANSAMDNFVRGMAHTESLVPEAKRTLPAYENAPTHLADMFAKYQIEPTFKDVSPADRQRFVSYGLLDRLYRDYSANPTPELKTILDDWKDPETGNPVTEADLQNWMTDHRDLIDRYKTNVQSENDAMRARAGAEDIHPGGLYGEYYVPGFNELNNIAASSGGVPARKPIFSVGKLMGKGKLSGEGQYKLDPVEIMRRKFGDNASNAYQREFWSAAVKRGVAIPQEAATDFVNGPVKLVDKKMGDRTVQQYTMTVDGKQTPAMLFDIGSRLPNVAKEELARLGIPERAWVPKPVYRELENAFNRLRAQDSNNPLSALTQVFISGALEALPHGRTIASARSAVLPKTTGIAPIDSALEFTKGSGLKTVIQGLQSFGKRNYTPEERYAAQKIASEYGVARDYQNTPIWNPIKWGGKLLYSEKGAFNNTLAEMYKQGKEFGWSDDEIGNAMRMVNTHSRALRSSFQDFTQKTFGAGPFYQTGMTSLLRTAKYGAIPTVIGGYVMWYSMLHKMMDEKHRFPWEVPGRKIGDLPLPMNDGKGRQIVVNVNLNRDVGNVAKWGNAVVTGQSLGKTPGEIAQDIIATGINQAIAPVMSGPQTAILTGLTGRAPYLMSSDEDYGLDLLRLPSARQPLFSKQRAIDLGESIFPMAGLAPRGVLHSDEYRPSETDKPFGHAGNYLANLLGIKAKAEMNPQAQLAMSKINRKTKELSARFPNIPSSVIKQDVKRRARSR